MRGCARSTSRKPLEIGAVDARQGGAAASMNDEAQFVLALGQGRQVEPDWIFPASLRGLDAQANAPVHPQLRLAERLNGDRRAPGRALDRKALAKDRDAVAFLRAQVGGLGRAHPARLASRDQKDRIGETVEQRYDGEGRRGENPPGQTGNELGASRRFAHEDGFAPPSRRLRLERSAGLNPDCKISTAAPASYFEPGAAGCPAMRPAAAQSQGSAAVPPLLTFSRQSVPIQWLRPRSVLPLPFVNDCNVLVALKTG